MTISLGGALPLTAESQDLRSAVERIVERHLGTPPAALRIEHRPSRYRTSFALDEIDVGLPGGTVLRMLRKDVGLQALHEAARAAKPAFLYHPLREIEVYRRVLGSAGVAGTAAFYGAEIDPDRSRYWLFVERVPGVELYQVGDLGRWKQVARSLAAMHARFGADPEARARLEAVPLVRYDAPYYRRWAARAERFAPPALRREVGALARRYARIVPRLLALPSTFLHGEFYASNVLVADRPDGRLRVCPVDWELAGLGPGLVDLAALVAGKWAEGDRVEISLAYLSAVREAGLPCPSAESFLHTLTLCRFHLAVQWLGWSPDWSPPTEHAHDWLAEAATLSEGLNL